MMRTTPSAPSRTVVTVADIDTQQPVSVRVLVVDDIALFRAAMAAVVAETAGFVVVGQVSSGEEAVTACTSLQPDLVLMDVNLPGIDGLEATRQVRALPAAPAVLLLSTYDADGTDELVRRSGAAAYITKGEFGPDRLTAAWTATQ